MPSPQQSFELSVLLRFLGVVLLLRRSVMHLSVIDFNAAIVPHSAPNPTKRVDVRGVLHQLLRELPVQERVAFEVQFPFFARRRRATIRVITSRTKQHLCVRLCGHPYTCCVYSYAQNAGSLPRLTCCLAFIHRLAPFITKPFECYPRARRRILLQSVFFCSASIW